MYFDVNNYCYCRLFFIYNLFSIYFLLKFLVSFVRRILDDLYIDLFLRNLGFFWGW